ncbi:MAG: ATP-binding protein, partial [Deltaproteobacteria bacterium]|nr:ATP-binding protein [Deltaproteobacteria bacterium]
VHLGDDVFTAEPVVWRPSTQGHPHLLVVGLSGMGKTTCLINICRQLREQGVLPIVFSYHQDIDERLGELLGDIRFVDYDGLGYNPLRRPAQEAKHTYLDVAGEIRDIFVAIFPELGDLQGEALRQAIKESYLEQGWGEPSGAAREADEPAFGRFVEILRDRPKRDRGMMTLLARLQELEDYALFAPCAERGSLWESERPVVIRVHSTQNQNLQNAFASLLFYGFYKEMFYRRPQDKVSHFIVFDEAHRAARLKLIPKMAQECRKYGIGLVLASQQTRDFHVSLFSLIANYLVLRLTDQDAKALVRNVTTSDQERSLVDKIKQLERYRAFFFCEGRRKPASISLAPPSRGPSGATARV